MLNYLGISVLEQSRIFLYAVVLGTILCVLYDVFRVIRIAFGGKMTVVFIEDILFSVLALVLTFIFVVAVNNGELRFYVLVGELLGFAIYYFTFGRVTMGLSKGIISILKSLLNLLMKPFVRLFRSLKGKKKIKKKKSHHISKNHLKIDK